MLQNSQLAVLQWQNGAIITSILYWKQEHEYYRSLYEVSKGSNAACESQPFSSQHVKDLRSTTSKEKKKDTLWTSINV